MTRRKFLLSAAAVTAILSIFPTTGRAQSGAEPVYLVTLPDKQVITLTTMFNADGTGAKAARVITLPEGYGKSDLSLFAGVSLSAEGYPVAAKVQFGPKSLPKALTLQGRKLSERVTGGENKVVWGVSVPESRDVIAYSGFPITLTTAYGALGRQYNLLKGGEQPFLCLVDFGVLTPTFYPITFRYDGNETIALESGPVKAHRLTYRTVMPHLPKEQYEGVVYVGPRGEALRCDTNLFGAPFKTVGKSQLAKKTGQWEVKLDRPGEVYVRERLQKGGVREIAIEAGDGNVTLAKGTVSKTWRALTLSSPWLGRQLEVSFAPTEASWNLAATEPVQTSVVGGKAWFMPYWFVTECWESGDGPWANMAVGDKREGSYFPLFTGQKEGGTLTIERKPDYTARIGGVETALRRYQVRTQVGYELLTDGKRMVYFSGSDGLKTTRNGFESLAGAIPAPKPPEAVAPKPSP